MLRAGINDKDNPLILCGLSDGNVERLKAGFPIKASLRSFGVELPGNLAIVHGTTEAAIEADMRKHGFIGELTRGTTDPRLDQYAEIFARHPRILIATVGLPRSGKTTWARKQAYPIVCPDAIRLAMHGQRFVDRAEPFVWATAKVMVRALFEAGHRHVILDATNTTKKRRDEWKSEREWGLFFKDMPETREECESRANAQGDATILPVIERMATQFEPLADDDPRWP